MKLIDDILNNITMYRLVLYVLIVWVGIAAILNFLHILPYDGFLLLASAAFLTLISWITNFIFGEVFETPTNFESIYISALILTLIIPPIKSEDGLIFLFWAAVWIAASKFIFAWRSKHIFNPAALSVAITSFVLGDSASWWVGTLSMMPFVLIGGLLIARKIRRFDLLFYFFLVSLVTIVGLSVLRGTNPVTTLYKTFVDSPILFFAFVMLTEPLTTPPTKKWQSFYGALVGFLFAPQLHFGTIYSTPELALITGNIFSYFVSPKDKLILKLKEKLQLSPDIFDFVFSSSRKIKFEPGQYMEWTVPANNADARGNRRYFTLASSPTENEIRLGVKIYQKSSSFKKILVGMEKSSKIIASQLAGDFTLPKDQNKKLVFIAGGIGITPFRSMIKYLVDTNQKRDLVLFYSNRDRADIVYKDVFDEAQKKLGIKTVYIATNKDGRLDQKMIKQEVPDFKDRTYYISGSLGMINGFKSTLKSMNVADIQIITDFFPGFA